MKWNLRERDREISYNIVETAVAVRPSKGLRGYAFSAEETPEFGRAAGDASPGGHFGQALFPDTLEIFAGAGWIFVEPRDSINLAAARRSSVPGAEAVRHAVINEAGELMIVTGLVTVQLPEDLTKDEASRVLREDGLQPVGRLRFAPNLFEARVSGRGHLHELVGELQAKTDRYHFVCPELLQIIAGRERPTDPGYSKQWQHNDNNGGSADIRSEVAWMKTRGAGARIAVIDTGFDITHPDLVDGIKSGGFFKDNGTERADFIPFQQGMTGFTDNPHGTFCLGMAGARADNGRGGCGSAPEADLMVVACLSDQVGTQATLARAVAYAADPSTEDKSATPADGADVISCSLAPTQGVEFPLTCVLDKAITAAATKGRNGLGVPIFWSVDNREIQISLDHVCSHANVIAVGRSDITNNTNPQVSGPFAFGPKLELLAPGVKVFSSAPQGGFDSDTGTSYAAPLAAGVAALILARQPNLTAEQVRARLRETCDRIGNVVYDENKHNDRFGYGRINAGNAVQ